MIRIIIDGQELEFAERDVKRNITQVHTIVTNNVRAAALTAVRKGKERMPIDTGRARASWGSRVPMPPALPSDGVFDEQDGGLTYVVGSNVEYIGSLNEGTSRQAPAGFIDGVALEVQEDMSDAIARDLLRLFE